MLIPLKTSGPAENFETPKPEPENSGTSETGTSGAILIATQVPKVQALAPLTRLDRVRASHDLKNCRRW